MPCYFPHISLNKCFLWRTLRLFFGDTPSASAHEKLIKRLQGTAENGGKSLSASLIASEASFRATLFLSRARRMKTGLESPQRGFPSATSSRINSVSSSKIKLSAFGRVRKTGCERNVVSALLQQRQALRVVHEKVDVTPKPLVHASFSIIDENQMTALETIGLLQTGSDSQLTISPSKVSGLGTSRSSVLLKTLSVRSDELQMESLLSTQICELLPEEDEDAAPSPFFLPR